MDSHLTDMESFMKVWSWVASVLAATFLLLFGMSIVFGWGMDAASKDCEHLGKFHKSGRVYECRLIADHGKEA